MGEFQKFLSKSIKSSYTEIAYEEIKKLILDGEIRPGELIREADIAEYLHMSRTPVREAVRRLEAEEILFVRPGMGSFLKSLSAKDMKDVYEVRETLELIACRTALQKITDSEIAALKHAFVALSEQQFRNEFQNKENRLQKFNELDGAVHDLILERSDNDYIKILARHISFKAARYRVLSFQLSVALEESIRRHLELLNCLESRDEGRCTECIKEHIRWSSGQLTEYLKNN